MTIIKTKKLINPSREGGVEGTRWNQEQALPRHRAIANHPKRCLVEILIRNGHLHMDIDRNLYMAIIQFLGGWFVFSC